MSRAPHPNGALASTKRQTLESSSPLGKLVSNNGMPRAASPSAASRHRLLLPPLLAGLDFCRLAAPTSSAASRPFFSPFLARLALPRTSAAFTGWPRLLPPCGSASFCRLAAELCRLAAFLPPSGPTSSGLVGRGGPEELQEPRAQGLTRVSPGAAHQSTTPPPPACYEEQARGLRRLS
ncbi:hypothetical protein HRG_014819 [Hirsutella rhossiliensis]